MTYEEAVTLVGMVVNSWPGPDWETPRLAAYVEAIMPLDAEVTTRAVARAVGVLKFRPSVAELREFVRIERSLSEPDEVRYMPIEHPIKPAWVDRWERARAYGDMRPFPEQLTAMDSLARQSVEHYAAYKPPDAPLTDASAWVQPEEWLA